MIEILHKIATKHNKSIEEVESIINFQFRKAREHVVNGDRRRFYMRYLFSIYFNQPALNFIMNLRAKKLSNQDIKDEIELEEEFNFDLQEYIDKENSEQ